MVLLWLSASQGQGQGQSPGQGVDGRSPTGLRVLWPLKTVVLSGPEGPELPPSVQLQLRAPHRGITPH